jgi:NADH:ubiquinone reductase (non-electrogenic)
MGIFDFTIKRALPAAAIVGPITAWAAITSANDDWDDYFTPSSSTSNASNVNDSSSEEKIVILGSGWAALNALRKCAAPNKSVVIVSPRPHFLYTPLLASSSVGTITLRSACEPLRSLVESAASKALSATFVRADAREIDVHNKKVYATTDADGMGLELSYDKLVIAVGAQPNTFGIPGVQDHALFLKEAEDSAKLHARLLCNLEKASALSSQGEKYRTEIDRLLKIVVVGGGPTGVELCAELADFKNHDVAKRYGTDISDRIQIVLVEMMPQILMPFDESLRNVAKEHLISKGVEVRTGCAVTYADEKDVTFQPSTPRNASAQQKAEAAAAARSEEVGALVWVGGVGARPLVKKLAKQLGQTDMRGLKVDETLKVVGTEDVYAIGDAALSGYAPTAQVAAQAGKHVGRAIRDGVDTPFKYNHMGSLICLGQANGMAQFPDGGKFNIWDAIGAQSLGGGGDDDQQQQRGLTGMPAFVIWRSTYWTKLLSTSSRLSLASDWVKAKLNGREVVEPVLKRAATLKAPVESFGTELRRNNTIRLVQNSVPAGAIATDAGEKKKKRFWLF